MIMASACLITMNGLTLCRLPVRTLPLLTISRPSEWLAPTSAYDPKQNFRRHHFPARI